MGLDVMHGTGGSKAKVSGESSGDRLLSVLGLFTVEQPQWTVDDAAKQLGVSGPTAYRYFKRLTGAGLISPVSGASYTLGPAIIQMDRQIQVSDPMLRAARGVMHGLIPRAGDGSALLLCRLFHDRVMCVHQVLGRGRRAGELRRAAGSCRCFAARPPKIILAHLPAHAEVDVQAERRRDRAGRIRRKLEFKFVRWRRSPRRRGGDAWRNRSGPRRRWRAAVRPRPQYPGRSLSFALPAGRADNALIGRLTPRLDRAKREIERLMNEEPGEPAQFGPASRCPLIREESP
jgi:DNA-binding IclR family transcriptional regulator